MERVQLHDEDEGAPPLVEDFGFHYPLSYVSRAALFLERSHWQCWPEAGGWAEQDSFLVEDVLAFLALRARLAWEVKHLMDSDYEVVESDIKPMRFEDL